MSACVADLWSQHITSAYGHVITKRIHRSALKNPYDGRKFPIASRPHKTYIDYIETIQMGSQTGMMKMTNTVTLAPAITDTTDAAALAERAAARAAKRAERAAAKTPATKTVVKKPTKKSPAKAAPAKRAAPKTPTLTLADIARNANLDPKTFRARYRKLDKPIEVNKRNVARIIAACSPRVKTDA